MQYSELVKDLASDYMKSIKEGHLKAPYKLKLVEQKGFSFGRLMTSATLGIFFDEETLRYELSQFEGFYKKRLPNIKLNSTMFSVSEF